jgi:hypothetical protein
VSYFKSAVARPNCIYCGKPVSDDAWDEESHSWANYSEACMMSHPQGRYGVKMTEGELSIMYSIRVTTPIRAKMMADYLTRMNPKLKDKLKFEVVDLGKGIANECKASNH